MGPLDGLRVVELEGLGPAPFCGMMLADMGAEVISVTRRSAAGSRAAQISERGKKTIALNLKHPDGVAAVLDLCAAADILIEGFRPGVAERLGIGPEACAARNPKLVYGRMTGWGQTGPLAGAAGHDINYISLSGALHAIGRAGERPVPPLNLVGDFGGGGMFLAFGLMCAVFEAQRSGRGQVVDVSMVDGSAALMHMMYQFMAMGAWRDERGVNMLDGAAHFYDTYETADGRWVALAAVEPKFFAEFARRSGLAERFVPMQYERAQWPALREAIAALLKTRTRDDWCARLEGSDACFTPVLDFDEAPRHRHAQARAAFVEVEGGVQPAPAPRFARSAPEAPRPAPHVGEHTRALLAEAGLAEPAIAALLDSGAARQAEGQA